MTGILRYSGRLMPAAAAMAIAVFALLLTVGQSRPAFGQATRLVADVDFKYSVNLGESIDFELAVDQLGLDPVDDVQVHIRPVGPRNITRYAYAEVTFDEELLARYEFETAAPTYFPPGTMFDVRFVIYRDDEPLYETEEYRVDYLDEGRGWASVRGDNLELLYYDIERSSVERLRDETADRLDYIREVLGVEEHPTMRAVIFPGVRDLSRYGPTFSRAATEGNYFGGFAYSGYNLTLMSSPSAGTLIHEMTHLLHDVAMVNPGPIQPPSWLTEGIATYLERSERPGLPYGGRSSVRRFRELKSVPGLRSDIGDFYQQSADFMGFLAEREGAHSLGRLLAELRDGARLDAALTTVYGGNIDELENLWRAQYALPLVDVRTGTVATVPRDYPPTIEGIPTPRRGSMPGSGAAGTGAASDPPEQVARVPTTVAHDGLSGAPQESGTTSEPESEREGYVTSPADSGFRANPTMLVVFVLLALGFGVLLYRRVTNP